MKRAVLLFGVVALLAGLGLAHPRGSGTRHSVCNTPCMEPIAHIEYFNATGYNNTDQYTLHGVPTETPGVTRVILSCKTGPVFKGFVIRATTGQNVNSGRFLKDGSNGIPLKTLSCDHPKHVAVSNSHRGDNMTDYEMQDLTTATVLWENHNSNNYSFQAMVVPDVYTYFTGIFSTK